MPEFGSPFSGLANDRKLTDEELIASPVAAALHGDQSSTIYAGAPHGLAYTLKNQLNADVLAFLKN